MNFITLYRLITYVTVSVFSLVVLGLAGNSLSLTQAAGGYFYFDALAVAAAVLTLGTLISVLIIDHFRAHAPLSWTTVELGWLGFLWLLWLADAADAASLFAGASCGLESDGVTFIGYQGWDITRGNASTVCSQSLAVMGFGFLIWIMLTGMFAFLLTFAIRVYSAGHRDIWVRSAAQVDPGRTTAEAGPGVMQQGAYGMNQPDASYGTPVAGQYGVVPPAGQYGQGYSSVPNAPASGYGPNPQVGGYGGAAQV